MRRFITLFLICVMVQPMSFAFGTKKTMEKIMNSWQGENINSVIDVWGYPSAEKEIAGKKLYCWYYSRHYVSGDQYGVYGGEVTCNRILEVDKDNNVIKWQWDGNRCPATYITSKKWVNPNNNPWEKTVKSEL